MSKSFNGRITKWVWDGNVLLHEWVEHFDDVNEDDEIPDSLQSDETIAAFLQAQLDGRPSNGPPDQGELPLPTTWLFDPDTFAPASKIVGDKHYSIITDHLGTPLSMFDEVGVQMWGAELDIFGSVKNLQGDKCDCPFRYPGQYEDGEIGLYYNRFRYYDPEGGEYVSQDPIGLLGGMGLLGYVKDPLNWIDPVGLAPVSPKTVLFSQHDISPIFGDGRSVNGLITRLKDDPKYIEKIEPIRKIRMKDLPTDIQEKLIQQEAHKNSVFTLDNRRLYAAKQIPSRWATKTELSEINLKRRFSIKTGGKGIGIRCG